jgi:hypothetical protein
MEHRRDWEQILLAGLTGSEREHVKEVIRRTDALQLRKLRERSAEDDHREEAER